MAVVEEAADEDDRVAVQFAGLGLAEFHLLATNRV